MAHAIDPRSFGFDEEPLVDRVLEGAESTRAFGVALAGILRPGDFVGLVGDLGAGKTTLMQGLVGALGSGDASSPTYTLVHEYPTDPMVVHFDLYRLDDVDDLESIGYWDYLDAEELVCCVEWLDRVPEAWPGQGALVALSRDGEGRRRLQVWAKGPLEQRLEPLRQG